MIRIDSLVITKSYMMPAPKERGDNEGFFQQPRLKFGTYPGKAGQMGLLEHWALCKKGRVVDK